MKSRALRYFAAVSETLLTAALGFLLLIYGGVKVFGRQFHIRQYMLDMPAGELEGGQLVWLMHGFSRTYEIALGLAECAAALILFWPRTRTLGALACAAIMANITLLNVEYEIGALSSAAPMLLAAVLILVLRLARRPRPQSFIPARPVRIVSALFLTVTACVALLFAALMVRAVKELSEAFPIAGRYHITSIEYAEATQIPSALAMGAILYLEFNGEAALRHGEIWWFGEYSLTDRTVQARLYPLPRSFQEPTNQELVELRGEWIDDSGSLRILCAQPPIVLELRKENRVWPR